MKIGILGNKGRMGQTLMAMAANTAGVELVGGVDKGDNVEAFIAKCDAVIDFTLPEASIQFAWDVAKHHKIHVIGTTGFTNAQIAKLEEYSKEATIFWSPNMSIGVNVTSMLAQKAAELLDESYDIEIVEMHHRYKKDSPSGTALLLGESVAKGRKTKFIRDIEHNRSGERVRGDIGYAVLRGGNVIGDHTVLFAGDMDRVEITHKAQSREIFASGAIKAAIWCKEKPHGFYSMKDMLKF
jgi:4-hydroxy-tetrahydrodipicolinate reductase